MHIGIDEHVAIFGMTGTGKTYLARRLLAVVPRVIVLDPKGDLVADLLDRLPAQVAGRTVLFDPDRALSERIIAEQFTV